MDVSFVLAAARRRWWVVLLCAALGLIPFLALRAGAGSEYESTARLLVTPPSDAPTGVSFSPDPDRYIVGQLGILRSESMALQVAAVLKGKPSVKSVQDSVTIESQPGSDVVSVGARDSKPQRAREIADSYVNEYFKYLRQQISETQKPELDSIDQQIAALTNRLKVVDEKLRDAISPFLPGGSRAGSDRSAIPTAEQVAPELNSEKLTLLTRYNEIVANRTRQEIGSRLRVTSQIVERASLPTIPTEGAGSLLIPAGVLAGLFGGVIAAALLAFSSPKVLDRRRVEETIGVPLVGSIPRASALPRDPRTAAADLPENLRQFVDVLRVRADGFARPGRSARILVAGAGAGADTAGLAAALAGRYAAEGTPTVLVDQDSRSQALTRVNSGPEMPDKRLKRGIRALDATETAPGRGGVRFVAYDRSNIDMNEVTSEGASGSPVVVVDGGALMSSSTARLSQESDVVVLAIPLGRQRKSELRESASLLRSRGKDFLPVISPAARE